TYLTRNAEDAAHPARGQSSWDDRKSAENSAKALTELLNENATPLLPMLDRTIEKSPDSGRYVLGALASVKKLPPGAVDLALKYMQSKDEETRQAAVKLAGKLTSEREAARWIPEA